MTVPTAVWKFGLMFVVYSLTAIRLEAVRLHAGQPTTHQWDMFISVLEPSIHYEDKFITTFVHKSTETGKLAIKGIGFLTAGNWTISPFPVHAENCFHPVLLGQIPYGYKNFGVIYTCAHHSCLHRVDLITHEITHLAGDCDGRGPSRDGNLTEATFFSFRDKGMTFAEIDDRPKLFLVQYNDPGCIREIDMELDLVKTIWYAKDALLSIAYTISGSILATTQTGLVELFLTPNGNMTEIWRDFEPFSHKRRFINLARITKITNNFYVLLDNHLHAIWFFNRDTNNLVKVDDIAYISGGEGLSTLINVMSIQELEYHNGVLYLSTQNQHSYSFIEVPLVVVSESCTPPDVREDTIIDPLYSHYTVNTTITIACVKSNSQKMTQSLQCVNTDDIWRGPSWDRQPLPCEEITCTPPRDLLVIHYPRKSLYRYGDEITHRCLFILTISSGGSASAKSWCGVLSVNDSSGVWLADRTLQCQWSIGLFLILPVPLVATLLVLYTMRRCRAKRHVTSQPNL